MAIDEHTPLLDPANSTTSTLIPPDGSKEFRRIILLLDGTGDEIDKDITNIVHLKNMLHHDDKTQIVEYRPGIGTWPPPQGNKFTRATYGYVTRTFDKAIASNFESHVLDAYQYLMKTYQPGDKICLFGFSRGAYTARAVAAMTNIFGLLPPDSITESEAAIKTYFGPGNAKFKDPSLDVFNSKVKQFWDDDSLKSHSKSRHVIIEFVGVWDTVNSVGLFSGFRLPYTATNKHLRTFRHAIALDERRARFKKNSWSRSNDKAASTSIAEKMGEGPLKNCVHTNVEEVYFAGAHCDVGGGSVPNGTKPCLANIALRWMIRECFKTKTGIIFTSKGLEEAGIDVSTLYPIVKPRPEALPPQEDLPAPQSQGWLKSWGSWLMSAVRSSGSSSEKDVPPLTEEEHDRVDALAPIYDQLALKPYKWWALEMVRLKIWDPATKKEITMRNMGNGRKIRLPDLPLPADFVVKVHRTVRTRMMTKTLPGKKPYVPSATMGGEPGQPGTLLDVNSKMIQWVD